MARTGSPHAGLLRALMCRQRRPPEIESAAQEPRHTTLPRQIQPFAALFSGAADSIIQL